MLSVDQDNHCVFVLGEQKAESETQTIFGPMHASNVLANTKFLSAAEFKKLGLPETKEVKDDRLVSQVVSYCILNFTLYTRLILLYLM